MASQEDGIVPSSARADPSVSVFDLGEAVSDFFQDYDLDMQRILSMIKEAGVGWKSQPEAS